MHHWLSGQSDLAYSIAMVAFNRLFFSARIDPLTKISFRVASSASSIYVKNCIHLKSASIIESFIIGKCESSGAKLDQSTFNEDKISFFSHDCSCEKFQEMQERKIMLRIRIFFGFWKAGADMDLLDIQKLPRPPSTEKYANLIQSHTKFILLNNFFKI